MLSVVHALQGCMSLLGELQLCVRPRRVSSATFKIMLLPERDVCRCCLRPKLEGLQKLTVRSNTLQSPHDTQCTAVLAASSQSLSRIVPRVFMTMMRASHNYSGNYFKSRSKMGGMLSVLVGRCQSTLSRLARPRRAEQTTPAGAANLQVWVALLLRLLLPASWQQVH